MEGGRWREVEEGGGRKVEGGRWREEGGGREGGEEGGGREVRKVEGGRWRKVKGGGGSGGRRGEGREVEGGRRQAVSASKMMEEITHGVFSIATRVVLENVEHASLSKLIQSPAKLKWVPGEGFYVSVWSPGTGVP